MNHLDPREVLAYLNELGYHNITGEQLKEFMKDLKKLIKHDQRIARLKEKENQEPAASYASIFSNLYENSTVASRAKCVPKYENIITLHITKPRVQKSTTNFNQDAYRDNFTSDSVTATVSTIHSSEVVTNIAESTISSQPKPCLKESKNCRPSTSNSKTRNSDLKPKVSFIRPRLQIHPSKSDPVALYQFYQNEWKKQKLPGEDPHANLRWAIRERMLGAGDAIRTVSSASSTNTLMRKKVKNIN